MLAEVVFAAALKHNLRWASIGLDVDPISLHHKIEISSFETLIFIIAKPPLSLTTTGPSAPPHAISLSKGVGLKTQIVIIIHKVMNWSHFMES